MLLIEWQAMWASDLRLVKELYVTHSVAGYVGLRINLDVWEKRTISCPCQKFNHDS
jgi:hypothetical protein